MYFHFAFILIVHFIHFEPLELGIVAQYIITFLRNSSITDAKVKVDLISVSQTNWRLTRNFLDEKNTFTPTNLFHFRLNLDPLKNPYVPKPKPEEEHLDLHKY